MVPFGNFFVQGSFTPKNLKKGVFWVPSRAAGYSPGIHFRSTAIVQSVSGDVRDVPLTTEFLGWSHGLGARERQSCPFFGNDARFTARTHGARRSIAASSCLQTTAHNGQTLSIFAIPRTPDTREMLLAAAGNRRLCK